MKKKWRRKLFLSPLEVKRLVDAASECNEILGVKLVTYVQHYVIGSSAGPNIFIKICAWSTAQISRELMIQVKDEFGKMP